MQASGGDVAAGDGDFELELRRALYRFDCPDAHTLGEYQLDLLDDAARVRVAAHALECDECRSELQTLRAFLAAPVNIPEPVLTRARRIVATLFTPRQGLAYSGLRGSDETSARFFEAGDITVSVATGQRPGSLIGLVVAPSLPPDALASREVRLLPRAGAPLATTLDDLGNFELREVGGGVYVLEVDLPDGVVVIDPLQID